MSEQMESNRGGVKEVEESALVPTYVGRQPMFNENLETRAYELLYRNSCDNWAEITDSDLATGQTFWNTFIELGQDNVAETQRAYVNVTPTFLRSNCIQIFPKEKLALELSAADLTDSQVVEFIQSLRNSGYRIVLDGHEPGNIDDEMLSKIDEIKLDVAAGPTEACKLIVTKANELGIVTIAKRIETFDCFEDCRRAGFNLFQGHFLSKPQIVVGGRVPADGIARMRLLAAINDTQSGLEKMQDAICNDVGLSYKLLHYVNSAMFAFSNKVESIQHAIMLLGMKWIRTWANLVILSGVSDKPSAIFNTAVIRGRMCELLSRETEEKNPDSFFTIGLFSTLECLFDRPMDEILEELPIAQNLKDALMTHEGIMGEALKCTINYEQSAWHEVGFQGMDSGAIRDTYVSALQWAAELRGSMS
ncbi:MAG: EAL and modified HD-GYP domain-containing signal transduction protein [Planctomycetota bacterium]|jgi:EAL and modified HD-GYP domain-containing signal transduction protein